MSVASISQSPNTALRKRVLIPLWTCFLAVVLVYLGFSAFVISSDKAQQRDEKNDHDISNPPNDDWYQKAYNTAGAAVAMSIISLLLTVAEIVLFAIQKLRVSWFLGSSCLNAFIWIVFLAATFRSGFQDLTVIFSPLASGVSLALVIYGAVVMHQVRKSRKDGIYPLADVQDADSPFHDRNKLNSGSNVNVQSV